MRKLVERSKSKIDSKAKSLGCSWTELILPAIFLLCGVGLLWYVIRLLTELLFIGVSNDVAVGAITMLLTIGILPWSLGGFVCTFILMKVHKRKVV